MTGNCEYGGAILRGEEPKIFYYWFPGMLPVSGLPLKGWIGGCISASCGVRQNVIWARLACDRPQT